MRRLLKPFLINQLLTVPETTITLKVRWKQAVFRVVDEHNGLVNSVCDEYAPDV